MSIPAAVLHHFAGDPVGPMYTLEKEARNPHSTIYSEINDFLSSIDESEVAKTHRDPTFRHLHSSANDFDRAARVWIASQALCRTIAAYRLDVLYQDSTYRRPRPYDHPALQDLIPDDEHLVPLRHFDFDGARLLRNDHAFTMLSTTGEPNSTHWLAHACHWPDVRDHVRVRLDPLLHGSANQFHPPHQRMRVYGPSLDWDRLARLQATEHGRWSPERLDGPTHCTDYAWVPRGSEVSFICEEVPTVAAAPRRPGRYFHLIYHPSSAVISHLDAAVRIYTNAEVVKRHSHHVRNAGKVGLRTKVLRIDESLPRTVFSLLCQAFFVWNRDVSDYFGVGCK